MKGWHLMLDGKVQKELLWDHHYLYDLMQKICRRIKMKALTPPYLVHAHLPKNHPRAGITGIMVIEYSHISIHTFPNKDGHLMIDVFSCKKFDMEGLAKYLLKELKMKEPKIRMIER